MSKFTLTIIAFVFVMLAGGFIFLMTWDIPAPSSEVTKTISNDRFPS